MLSNRSYLTGLQHCSFHNMSLFMAREGCRITSTRDQVVTPGGVLSASAKGRELRDHGFDLDSWRTVQDIS